MLNRGASVIVAAALVASVLSGCATPEADTTPPAGEPTATTPTAEPDPGPVVRVGATCEDFADVATAAALLVKATDVRPVEYSPTAVGDFVQQQYGSLVCRWAPGGVYEPGGASEIDVIVAPDVSDAVWEEIQPLVSGGTGVVDGGFAGEAYSNCFGSTHGRSCRLHTRVHGYVLEVALTSSQSAAEGVSRQWGNPFLAHAVDVVSSLPAPASRWEPSAVTEAEFSSCAPLTADGTLASDIGAESVDIAFVGPSAQDGAAYPAGAETGYRICYLQGLTGNAAQNFHVEVLPSGSWAWEQLAALPGATSVSGVGDEAIHLDVATGESIVFRLGTTLASATAESDFAPANADLDAIATIAAQRLAALLG